MAITVPNCLQLINTIRFADIPLDTMANAGHNISGVFALSPSVDTKRLHKLIASIRRNEIIIFAPSCEPVYFIRIN